MCMDTGWYKGRGKVGLREGEWQKEWQVDHRNSRKWVWRIPLGKPGVNGLNPGV